jgi:hypothetical protein
MACAGTATSCWPRPCSCFVRARSDGLEANYIKPEQDERYETDAWEAPIADYLETLLTNPKVTISQVAKYALSFVSDARIGTADARRIAAVLERQGWRRAPRHGNGRWWIK